MQQRHQPQDQVSLTPNPPETLVEVEARIEAYLDTVFAPLQTEMASEQRQTLRKEARTHLFSMVAAYEELGNTPQEALANALQQFGKADQVAKEWERTLPTSHLALQRSSKIAFRYFAGATVLTTAVLFGTGNLINFDYGAYLSFSLYLLLPGMTGLGVGFLAPLRPMRAAFAAMTRLALPTLLAYFLWASCQHFSEPGKASLFFGVAHFVLWMLVGTTGAGVGGLARKVRHRLRRA